MFEFLKRQKIVEPAPIQKNETVDYSELNGDYAKVKDEITEALKKQFDYTQFELSRDDQSNYFGLEFDIQTTASRLKGLYVREPWVYACGDRIARNASSVPLLIVDAKTEEPLPDHPANQIVNGGSAFQDEYSKRWVQYLDLILTGNAHLIMDNKYTWAISIPIELVTMEARTVKDFEEILKYGPIDKVNIFGYSTQNVSMTLPFNQCIHFKLPNPFNPFYGLSPFAAASRSILLDRYKNEFEMAFYHRGATHSGVIENEQELSKEKMRRLIATFENLYTGKRNWWRNMFLPKGAKWKQSSLTMSEMQHLEGLRENRLTLLAVLGMPPSQVGIVQDVNRSTSEAQEKIFWQNTIIPLVQFYCAGYNNSYLFKYVYADAVKVIPDLSGVQAVEGSIITKGEAIQAVKEVLKVNEIRVDILGYPELPPDDPRGNLFVKEITPNVFGSVFDTIKPKPSTETPPEKTPTESENNQSTDDTETVEEKAFLTKEKEIAKSSILLIEKALGGRFLKYFRGYETKIWTETVEALEAGRNVRAYLMMKQSDRQDDFILEGLPVLLDAMERGFSMSMLSTKRIQNFKVKVESKYEFTPQDEIAIDQVKEKTRDGQRKTLIMRELDHFKDWDENYSEHIMQTIEDGLKAGKTNAEIAKEIKTDMELGKGESYRDQAFTITRTETLFAVSEGIKWSNDVLNTVFTEVNKIWMHIGDVKTNPHARKEHAGFEKLGVKPSNYIYKNPETKNELAYPRDPAGGAEDVINCRCSMSNVIPKTAHSRAKIFLED